MGALQTQRGLFPSIVFLYGTGTSQRHAGFVQCHCSPDFTIIMAVPSLTAGSLRPPRRQLSLGQQQVEMDYIERSSKVKKKIHIKRRYSIGNFIYAFWG
jgi:hypothetical protein